MDEPLKTTKMTKDEFIRKWLGNRDVDYTEPYRDEMREDLILVGDNPKEYFPNKDFMQDVAEALATDLSFNVNYQKRVAEKILEGMEVVLDATYGEYYAKLRASFEDRLAEWAKSLQNIAPDIKQLFYNEFWNLVSDGEEDKKEG